MKLIRYIRYGLALASLGLAAPTFAATNCIISPDRPGTVLEYSGECQNGWIHGVADVMLELPSGRGRARQFGWFQYGVPQGVHVVLLRGYDAPAFAILMSFDASGHSNWSFGLPSASWPSSGTLLTSGPWEDVDGKARKAGIEYSVAKRADGTSYAEGLTMIKDFISQTVDFSLAAGVQSVTPSSIRDFLTTISITQPMANVNRNFTAAAIFPDNEEAPPPPVATPAVLGADEFIAKTANDCGLIEKLNDPKYKQARLDTIARNIWQGLCVSGLALGPGKMIYRNDKNEAIGSSELWMLYGKPIGRSSITYAAQAGYPGSRSEAMTWNGMSYSRSLNTKNPVEPKEGYESYLAGHIPLDTTQRVIYSMYPACYDAKKQTTSPCIAENRHFNTGNYEDGITRHFCKPGKCVAKWHELTDSVVAAFDEFERAHALDVDAAKKSVEPALLKAMQEKRKADAEAVLVAKENKRKAQVAQRQQQLNQANQSRRPVVSPNLNQLIRQTMGDRK